MMHALTHHATFAMFSWRAFRASCILSNLACRWGFNFARDSRVSHRAVMTSIYGMLHVEASALQLASLFP